MIGRIAHKILPGFIASRLAKSTAGIRGRRRNALLKKRLAAADGSRRVVIGAGGVHESGWIPTEWHQLNLLNEATWHDYLEPESVDMLLAEHVWEHLTLEDGRRAAAICYRFLKPGGYIRVAVPDGLHPDPEYREYIKVDGVGGGELGGHKVVYTYRTLDDVFKSAGFRTELLEYHDEAGRLIVREWDPAGGMIHRSNRLDKRGAISVILDARK